MLRAAKSSLYSAFSGSGRYVALGSQPLGPKKFTFFSDSRSVTFELYTHSPSRQVTMFPWWDSMMISLAV